MRGMQAIAAAKFGGKSIDDGSLVGFAPTVGSENGRGGGGGEVGSIGSGMTYIHKLEAGFVKPTPPRRFDFQITRSDLDAIFALCAG